MRVSAMAGALLLSAACVRTHIEAPTAVRGSGKEGAGMEGTGMLSIGGRTHAVTRCRSGDREYFHGVDLGNAEGTAAVRVVIDPIEGARLRVTESGTTGVALDRRACRQLDAAVDHTRWRVNRIRDVSGFLDAECGTGPDAVSIHVRFTHCH